MGLIALAAGYFRQRGDLPPPRTTFLTMGEDDVAIDYGRFHNNSSSLKPEGARIMQAMQFRRQDDCTD
jgi:hypothetical protein